MASFFNFPTFKSDEVSVFGKNERMSTLPINLIGASSFNQTEYPVIDVRRDLFTQHHQDVSVLIRVNQNIYKQFISTYVDQGFEEALSEVYQAATDHPTIAKIAWGLLQLLEAGRTINNVFQPTVTDTDHEFSGTRNWQRSPIRCIAWHPNYFKLALATNDDTVRLYQRQAVDSPVLKRKEQKGVLCMGWRPWSASELAVGGQNGLVIWNVDQMLSCMAMRSQSFVLAAALPVTSLSWNSSGTCLATGSTSTPDVYLWDVDDGKRTLLRRVRAPAALVSWSPNGAVLCSTSTTKMFRIWETQRWTEDSWSLHRGVVQSVTWTPCSLFMLFVTSADPFLYCLGFVEEHLFTNDKTQQRQAIPIADLTKVQLDTQEVGGLPNTVVMNPKGTLVAITFKTTDLIAIFSVSVSKFVLNVTPFGLINGLGNEYPTIIQFENTKERDVLTICWSSGRVQYFPFV